MKFIKILQKSRRWLSIEPNLYFTFLMPFFLLTILATALWLGGPYLTWQNYAPLAAVDKRLYCIIFLYLAWLLLHLLAGLNAPNPYQYQHPGLQKALLELQQRFEGAIQFLKKTTITRHKEVVRLHTLPWYLLIGPTSAGKTALLLHSDASFTLQKQLPASALKTSEHCDWWVTRDLNIIDVPGHYLQTESKAAMTPTLPSAALWWFLLRLIKKQQGIHALQGIVIALPLPELMQLNDTKKYHPILKNLADRLAELKKIFNQTIPCQLIITKCDLLSGFSDFFAEGSDEESKQAWGIAMPQGTTIENLQVTFNKQFDTLIKKINEQVLWRLHHERNAIRRPFIKDFPLQLERLKEQLADFLKKIAVSHEPLALQYIYLTSALQTNPTVNIATPPTTALALHEPEARHQAYFIKQIITHGLLAIKNDADKNYTKPLLQTAAYATAAIAVIGSATFLGHDFEIGMKHTYAISEDFATYQLSMQSAHSKSGQFLKTLRLLNALKTAADGHSQFILNIQHLFSYYSHQTDEKSQIIYNQALQNILLPEIRDYLAYYLSLPVNNNADDTYAILKSYLMLGDIKHFNSAYVLQTVNTILPNALNNTDREALLTHIQLALNNLHSPLPINTTLIQTARKYFTNMPASQLSYLILKSINDNDKKSGIHLLASSAENTIYANTLTFIPVNMFTAKYFSTILNNDAAQAATEALQGNWVLGTGLSASDLPVNPLIDQIRATYINNYINLWQTFLNTLRLVNPSNLTDTNMLIGTLISSNSPLLQLLQTLHDNTYFNPVADSSPLLRNLGELIAKNDHTTASQLYQIFAGLDALHQYLQAMLESGNEQKAAYQLVANMMQHHDDSDPITRLRLIAANSPEPLNSWLNKIANTTWLYLMQDGTHYIDISWQDEVIKPYQLHILNRYPFDKNATQEVSIKQFTQFFGSNGTVEKFYTAYLQPLVDTSQPTWHWKNLANDQTLPLSDAALHQIQEAMRVRDVFFASDKLAWQFNLRPYELNNAIKSITVTIDGKQFTDKVASALHDTLGHDVAWPGNDASGATVALAMRNEKMMTLHFPGAWGFYKLISQSFDGALSKQKLIINLSQDTHPAKYLLATGVANNPFLALDLSQFKLATQISERG